MLYDYRVHLLIPSLYVQDTNSPVVNSKWHLSFEIPESASFSGCVQKAIDTGVVVARARRELIQVLRTLVLQHTKYPSSEQYNKVCERLVTKFPNLQDNRTGGYVSCGKFT